jgi:hypothetical protein
MSSPCENIVNPLMVQREGTDQAHRSATALAPASAPVDEHTEADWLVFAQRLSGFLRFYRLDNQYHGEDWKAFFARDVSAVLAVAAVEEVEAYRTRVTGLFRGIRAEVGSNPPDETALKQAFANLFSYVASLAWELDRLWRRLPDTVALKVSLRNLIQSRLAPDLHRLRAYHTAASSDLLDESATFAWYILGEPVAPASEVFSRPFSDLWTVTGAVNTDIFGSAPPAEVARRIYFAVNHNFFAAIFDQYLRALSRVTADARQQLNQTLGDWDSHEPHTALFLAFLKLFTFARDHLNTLTQRHLDFYYREVLRLRPKPARPSQAHVRFELAKHAPSEHLPKGTLLQAGKDSQGKEVLFALDEDLVPNKAVISSLKSFYRTTAADEGVKGAGAEVQQDWLYAAPVADSADGAGEKPFDPEQGWHPFANKQYRDGQLAAIAMPPARVGFAVASPYLFLTEGKRQVLVLIQVETVPFPTEDLSSKLGVRVTTAEGWADVSFQAGVLDSTTFIFANLMYLQADLPADFPAVTPYQREVHGEQFATEHPVLEVWLRQENVDANTYQKLSSLEIKALWLQVRGQGLRNLRVHNDFGVVDPSQPFQPFGPLPKKDASLILSHSEVFRKEGANVRLKITWKDLPSPAPSSPSTTLQFLRQGQWEGNTTESNLFDGIQQVSLTEEDVLPLEQYQDPPPYSVRSVKGFLRIKLEGDFGHQDYPIKLAEYLIDQAKESPSGSPSKPAIPYTPTIQALSLDYDALTTLDLSTATGFAGRPLQFFHLHPFGQTEEHPALRRPGLGEPLTISPLPRFRHRNAGDAFFEEEEEDGTVPEWLEHEGEFYLGIQQAAPPQNLSVLFQLAEGSANPLVKKPALHLHWSYLAGNHWVSFKKDEVSDRTGQLTRSGIIRFALSKGADYRHTLLPEGFLWLRAAVNRASEAVARILAVVPQTVLATFRDQDNAPDFLALPLPAGSISKLLEPRAAIKKVEQPFASFGGALPEMAGPFYQRVSERLRHKNRGLPVWDYEHLVLEAFPQIFKVKTLPHTRYEPGTPSGLYNEQAPGHVTVVTIPDLRNRNGVNPLQPYTSLGDLEAIHDFLRPHLSCFVTLHVRNPIFEQVKVQTEVKFFPGYDESFYLKLLKTEITRFLSPWAYGEGKRQDIPFGGKIYKSTLIDFVEERPYVDYLANFQLYHLPGNGLPDTEADEITSTRACSILVSVPEEQHLISALPLVPEEEMAETCGC